MSLRRALNKGLFKLGYQLVKLEKLHNINRFQEMLKSEYKIGSDFSFVQIGANDGVRFDDLYAFVASRKSTGIVVEPLSYYFKKLKYNYRHFPDVIAVNTAVHKTETEVLIHYVNPDSLDQLPEWVEGIGSINPEHYKESEIALEHMISEEVPCMHLMDIIKDNNFSKIDLLQIDVEGYDAEVIRMIDFNVIKPKYIKYEHKTLDKDERLKVSKLLTAQNYEIFKQGSDSVAVLTEA